MPTEEIKQRQLSGQWIAIIVAGILLVCLGLIGYLFLLRMESTEKAITQVNDRLETMSVELRNIGEKAAIAQSSAQQAEEYARTAKQETATAEAARDAYQYRATRAQEEVDLVRDDLESAHSKLEQFRKDRDQEMNRLQKALSKIADTRRTALGLVMNLGTDRIQFDFDKATLKQDNRETPQQDRRGPSYFRWLQGSDLWPYR